MERDMMRGSKFFAAQCAEQCRKLRLQPDHEICGADFICIDNPEARLAAGMQDEPIERRRQPGAALAC
jgi:hypothetical protein